VQYGHHSSKGGAPSAPYGEVGEEDEEEEEEEPYFSDDEAEAAYRCVAFDCHLLELLAICNLWELGCSVASADWGCLVLL